ncbi:MAG: sulfur carrier protein ThiS [Candidatus Glassbacteria bacterium]|nr:sulfur carrier protein ThiS [Candidatus Glassbacteria bacterium]
MITVTVNGEQRQVQDGALVADLLRELGIGERRVAVECNKQIVKQEQYEETKLGEGDVLEIIEFVGGGC